MQRWNQPNISALEHYRRHPLATWHHTGHSKNQVANAASTSVQVKLAEDNTAHKYGNTCSTVFINFIGVLQSK
jgi:hypothetical protein